MTDWFDELDLDPESTWLRMGTRALGDRPWLVRDRLVDDELALKASLLESRRDEVLHSPADAGDAARDVRELICPGSDEAGQMDPLEAAARAVQEDLCLLRRRDDGWYLDAACVCFPSRWRLSDKIGRPLRDVHAPVPGYEEDLDQRVTRTLDRLTDRPVLRRNWFVHPDGALFQPVAPAVEPVVAPGEVSSGLHLRSERQTLRALPSGWVLFTIRVQHATLGEALSAPSRRARFARYLRAAPTADLAHRGMSPAQVQALLDAIEARVHGGSDHRGGTDRTLDAGPESDTTSDS